MSAEVVATIVDPEGRAVDLTADRWAHIVDRHPELSQHQAGVLETVRTPTHRRPGPTVGEYWYYAQNFGPSRWLKVVVRYGAIDRGLVVTAFARRSMP